MEFSSSKDSIKKVKSQGTIYVKTFTTQLFKK
jgi:hypothetical protein